MCSPGHKGHDDLTSSPPSSALTAAVPRGFPASPDGNTRRGLRSLRDLTQHLTTRADDSHAPPVWAPLGHGVSPASPICQALVRFFALLRIKPHAPLLVRAPVNLPQLSRLSVGLGPEGRLRHRCSTRYLRIPPLHRVFHPPLPDPSRGGSGGFGGLSPPLRPPACRAAYARFTPNESG